MADAFTRAANCFALARSTTFPAERETAIARGTAIAEAAGLDLDLFDIPGRAKAAPLPPFRFVRFEFHWTAHVEETGRLLREHLDRALNAIIEAELAAGARDGESAYDAHRRNFNEACAGAKARDAQRQGNPA